MKSEREPMSCARAHELIPLLVFAQGSLIAAWAGPLRRHLDECGECGRHLDAEIQAALARGELPMAQVPEAVQVRVNQLEGAYGRRRRIATRLAALYQSPAVKASELLERLRQRLEAEPGLGADVLEVVVGRPEGAPPTRGLPAYRPLGLGARREQIEGEGDQDTTTLQVQHVAGLLTLGVRVDESQRTVEVRLHDVPPEEQAPLVALVPEDEKECPMVRDAVPEERESRLARFEDVPPGKHKVLLI